MAIKPVDLAKAYRLLQVGPTTMISARHNDVQNVMSAAWVGILDVNLVTACIDKQTFTRKLIEESGYFAVQIPTANQIELVLYAGGNSSNDIDNKLDKIPLFYQEGYDIPLVQDCAAWLICKVIPNERNEQDYDLFIGEVVAAWSDDRVFNNGHWIFDDAPDELRTVHYVAGGQFYSIGKGTKFDHGPGDEIL